jgi:hypothetical protein
VTSALGGTRTPNLLIRSQMLYPIELQALIGRIGQRDIVDALVRSTKTEALSRLAQP